MRAQETKILNFIEGNNKVFIIPPFQRNYSWSNSQCEELFDDIIRAIEKDKNHYIGNIVYYEGKNTNPTYSENILVDGQQRITTILILLCALRDMMDKEKDKNDIVLINKNYLKNEDASNEQFRVRLKQTAYDNDAYKSIVNGSIPKSNESNMYSNYDLFKSMISESKYSVKEIFHNLNKLEMVWVKLEIEESNLEDIQIIFEKINSTGEPLSCADLLRNYLLISNNSKEQERLYNNYWVKIERIISETYISDFVEDYLKMKVCHQFNKDEVYIEFKDYVEDNGLSREDVLQDMLNYSYSYQYIVKEYHYLVSQYPDSQNVARCISSICNLKPAEFKSIILYLLDYYKCIGDELLKTLNIIKCYLIRFRIVGISRGSGDLRSMVFSIMSKIINKEIKPDYESIYYELSNSSSEAAHYPLDDEFKAALMDSKKTNHSYGRIVLYEIEENETDDTLVELKEITIEHLMPQKLTSWWIKNLGGKGKSEETYDNYINCIGNLALLSSSYNSRISNKPWATKVSIMEGNGSFKTTREAFKKKNWNELMIRKRNEDLAKRACMAITPPKERERPITVQLIDSGIYSINEEINVTNSRIVSLIIDSKEYIISTWRELLLCASKICYEIDQDKFNRIVINNELHKSTRNKGLDKDDPIISIDKNELNSSKKLSGTDYYIETNLSANRVKEYTQELLHKYDLDEKAEIVIEFDEDE